MTLLDAPAYDEARAHRRVVMMYSAAGLLFVLFVGWWLAAGRPVDWPWQWNSHLLGRMAVNAFFTDLEKNDLPLWRLDSRQELAAASGKAFQLHLRALPEGLERE